VLSVGDVVEVNQRGVTDALATLAAATAAVVVQDDVT